MDNKYGGLKAFLVFTAAAEVIDWAVYSTGDHLFHKHAHIVLQLSLIFLVLITSAVYFILQKKFAMPQYTPAVNMVLHEAVWLMCGVVFTMLMSGLLTSLIPARMTIDGIQYHIFGILFHAALVLVTTLFGAIRHFVRKRRK